MMMMMCLIDHDPDLYVTMDRDVSLPDYFSKDF